jgi:hypothetical protein
MEQEIWKPVVGYEGRYEVSNLGRVKSLTITYRNKANRVCTYVGRLLRGTVNRDGYRLVNLKPKGPKQVHSVVCEAFIGPRPSKDHEVNHKNFDRTDNRATNLEWVLHTENVRHSVNAGRMKAMNGKKASNIKLTPETALAIRAALEAGVESREDIAARFGCGVPTVGEISLGKQWLIGAPRLDARKTANNPWKHESRRRKLTPEQVASIRSERAAGVPARDLAAKYSVAKDTVYQILRGESWAVI